VRFLPALVRRPIRSGSTRRVVTAAVLRRNLDDEVQHRQHAALGLRLRLSEYRLQVAPVRFLVW